MGTLLGRSLSRCVGVKGTPVSTTVKSFDHTTFFLKQIHSKISTKIAKKEQQTKSVQAKIKFALLASLEKKKVVSTHRAVSLPVAAPRQSQNTSWCLRKRSKFFMKMCESFSPKFFFRNMNLFTHIAPPLHINYSGRTLLILCSERICLDESDGSPGDRLSSFTPFHRKKNTESFDIVGENYQHFVTNLAMQHRRYLRYADADPIAIARTYMYSFPCMESMRTNS